MSIPSLSNIKSVIPLNDTAPDLSQLDTGVDFGQTLERLPQITTHTMHDFQLQCGRTLETVRAGWCLYATENGNPIDLSKFEYPEVELGRPVIVILPALTGSAIAKVPEGIECSQGDGWANHWIDSQVRLDREALRTDTVAGKVFLDSDRYAIVVVDHFGGNGAGSTTSAKELHHLGVAEDVTIRDGVELLSQAFRDRGLEEIHAVIGGSIGGGQAFHWIAQDQVPVRNVVDISGSGCQDLRAREFFRAQRDLVSDAPDIMRIRLQTLQSVSDLLHTEKQRSSDSNHVQLNGREISPFEYVVTLVDSELAGMNAQTPLNERLECARRIGFLLFVPPDFYQDKFDRYCSQGTTEQARNRLEQWFERQGSEFSSRFAAEALWIQCNMISESSDISPHVLAQEIIEKGVRLLGTAVHGDTLFRPENHRALYRAIEEQLYQYGTPREAAQIMSVEITDRINGHDNFFNPENFADLAQVIRQRLE